jgi:hypothetical protein
MAAQAEAVLREAQALAAALDRAKTTRRVLFLAFLIFVVVACWSFYGLYDRLRSDRYLNEIKTAFADQLKTSDPFTSHATSLVEKVRGPVQTVFAEQVKKDSPRYLHAMQLQTDKFVNNLQDQLLVKLDDFHDKAIMKNRLLVEQQFPAAANPRVQERLVANLHVAIENLVKKYYIVEMRKSMDDLFRYWDEIPPAPQPAKDLPSIEDQFIGTLMELLKVRLAQPAQPLQRS